MNRPKPAARGDFAKTPLAHLLIYALEKKLSGSLEFAAPDGRTSALTIDGGHVTKARTSEPVAHLGRVLVDLGFLTDDALNRTLLLVAQTKRLHGTILLEQKLVTDAQLREGLRVQLLRKVRHMFTLPAEATFAFYDGFDVLSGFGGDASFTTDPLPVIWRAVSEAPSWEHVHGTLTRMQNSRLRVSQGAAIGRFDFDKDVLAFLARVREKPMRVSEMTALGLLSPRMTQLLVYTLLITKQLEVHDTTGSNPPVPNTRPVTLPGSSMVSGLSGASGASIPPPPPSPAGSAPGSSNASGGSPMVTPFIGQRVVPSPAPSSPRVSSGSPQGSPAPPTASPGSGHVAPNAARLPKPSAVPSFAPPVGPSGGTGAPSEPPEGLSPELKARRNEVLTRARSIDKQDYFDMLGVKREATSDEIQAAFFALAKRYHPDRLPRELESVRDECQRVFARFGEAHQTLTDPEKRKRYMRLLAEGGATPDEQETIAAVIDAAQTFQKAEIFLKRNDLAQAELLCRKAYEADKQQPDYIALLAWLEAQKPENQTPKALLEKVAMLDKAVAISENCERAYFYRGMLHKKLSNAPAAMRDFRRAADLNPRNVDAAREVRLFEMRKGRISTSPPPKTASTSPSKTLRPGQRATVPPQDGGKGLLGKLFKK